MHTKDAFCQTSQNVNGNLLWNQLVNWIELTATDKRKCEVMYVCHYFKWMNSIPSNRESAFDELTKPLKKK